jgi:hypothetical protein
MLERGDASLGVKHMGIDRVWSHGDHADQGVANHTILAFCGMGRPIGHPLRP